MNSSLFLRCLAALAIGLAPAAAQVGKNTTTTNSAGDLTPVLLDAAAWNAGAPPGLWADIGSTGEQTSKELRALGPVFGVVPQQVQAFFESGQLQRVEVVFLEAGNFFGYRESSQLKYRGGSEESSAERSTRERKMRETKRAEGKENKETAKLFAERFAALERDLPRAIATAVGALGRQTSIGQGAALKSRVTEYVTDSLVLRFRAEDEQLVALELIPRALAKRKLTEGGSLSTRRKDVRENVQTLPNGDTIIANIPMCNQGSRGYCAIGTLTMIAQYYGLRVNIDALAAKAGYKEGDTENAKIQPIYEAVARESRLKMAKSLRFTFREAQRVIAKGQPLLVWRRFSRERDQFHSDFAKHVAAEPAAKLPNPKEREQKASWPTLESGGHASLVTGFNKSRGEVLFTESWGEYTRNRRMSADEMEATGYVVFAFEP